MLIEPLTEVTDRAVADIDALEGELHLDGPHVPVTRERVEEVVANDYAVLMTANDNGTIAGMATLYVLPKTTKRTAHIDDVVVSSAYRGQGLGEKLMRALIEEAKKRDVEAIELTSRPAREAAQKLYLKLGFEKRATDPFRLKL